MILAADLQCDCLILIMSGNSLLSRGPLVILLTSGQEGCGGFPETLFKTKLLMGEGDNFKINNLP